jgi:hypothetical protein
MQRARLYIRPSRFIPFLIILAIGMVIYPLFSDLVQAQSFAATLSPFAGLVQFKAAGSADWVTVRGSTLVHPGDQIRTGSNGYAHMKTLTGVDVSIFPTTELGVNELSLGQGSGQVFNIYQVVGTLFSNVKQNHAGDQIQIVLPGAGITVHGTQFYTFVSPKTHIGVLSKDHPVEVTTSNGQHYTVTPENFAYAKLDLSDVCTPDLLNAIKSFFVAVPLSDGADRIQSIRELLHDFLSSDLNPYSRAFLRKALGLPSTDLSKMTADEDEQDLQEVLKQIDSADLTKFDLLAFLESLRTYWENTYISKLTAPLAPVTCGTGKTTGETAQNCPDDFTIPASCGNGICETNRKGAAESVLSCPADCLPHEGAVLSCLATLNATLYPATPSPTPGGISPTKPLPTNPPATRLPPTNPPAASQTPKPSGP